MMLKSIIPFPIFAPLAPLSTAASPSNSGHSTTEVRFSRWNNANAEEFNRRRRTQQEIEDDIRRTRRFQSAENIVNIFDSDGLSPPSTSTRTSTVASKSNYLDRNPSFRSIGTPSTPSSPSIPGKKSKYSKPLNYNPIRQATSEISHPAFRKLKKKPIPQQRNLEQDTTASAETVKVSEDGVSYLVPEAPFEYMYSYTETPKVKPLALREPPVTPFGPGTMPRPWTGRKPLPPSKKKLPEFDSFVSPPNKKGVKPVQKPGPFLPGSGPKYVWKREEILGDPLTWEEVREMVESCRKTKRQLNMGRDGFTHNMLENIHAHWKRRRVCKIKCKGVCTVDMDNVCQQLEEKTGGTIIYRKGGVLYLFRGRNYNYKTRPRYPLMLWKPVTPVYPRLIKQVPEGLTWEEATEMRAKGRQLVPICRLAKNGVYDKLVENVKEAFEACELVRIDCQGLNASDYRRIGAKLKDLVPCVLISFENEHILVWRGKDWKSSLFVQPLDSKKNNPRFMGDGFINLSSSTDQTVVSPCSEVQQETMSSSLQEVEMLGTIDVTSDPSLDVVSLKNFNTSENDDRLSTAEDGVATPVNDSYDLSSKAVGVESPVNDSTSSEVAVGAVSPVIDSQSSEVAVGAVCPVNNSTSSEGAVGAVSSVKDSASSEVAVGAVSPVTDSPSSEVAVGAVSPVDDSPSSEVAVGAVSPVDDSPSSEVAVGAVSPVDDSLSSEVVVGAASPVINGDINSNNIHGNETITNSSKLGKEDDYKAVISGSGQDGNEFSSSEENGSDVPSTSTSPYFQKVQSLLRQAVESGSALILDDSIQDADAVYKRSVVFSRHAPLMPEYRRKQRKVAVQNAEGQEVEGGQVEMEKEFVPGIETQVKSTTKTHKKKEFPKDCDGAAPQGSLGVDELAKLLA